jgi:hypothetical protein
MPINYPSASNLNLATVGVDEGLGEEGKERREHQRKESGRGYT